MASDTLKYARIQPRSKYTPKYAAGSGRQKKKIFWAKDSAALTSQTRRCRPRHRRRCASPDVERWESDEDSEDSGDEREGDEHEVALSEAAILRLMA